MEEYIKWLENKIEVCLEDKDLQREHWAFCQALKKYRELALRQPLVSGALPLAEIIGYLERLKNYLSSGSTYCFDNEHDLNDSEELEKFIKSLRQRPLTFCVLALLPTQMLIKKTKFEIYGKC